MNKIFLTACIWVLWVALGPGFDGDARPAAPPRLAPGAGLWAQPGETPAAAGEGAITPVETTTPAADGSIVHPVQPGQSLWSIATAYGIPFETLVGYNPLDPAGVIRPGDRLLVRPSFTPTVTATATPIVPRATRTVWPTRAPLRPTRTRTPTPIPTATLSPALRPVVAAPGDSRRRLLGAGMIVVCAMGLLAVVVNVLRPK